MQLSSQMMETSAQACSSLLKEVSGWRDCLSLGNRGRYNSTWEEQEVAPFMCQWHLSSPARYQRAVWCVCGSGCRSRLWWDKTLSTWECGREKGAGKFHPSCLKMWMKSLRPRRLARPGVGRQRGKNEVTSDPFPKWSSSIVMTFYIGTYEILKYWSRLKLLINIWQSMFLLQNPKLRGSNENVKM